MNLTAAQQKAIEQGEPVTVTVGRTECVILRRDVYERDSQLASDDWTAEEMNLLADEAETLISEGEVDGY
jgi:hypothetical protein